ncbi:MAG: DUF2487 domain-containing protein [Caldibacillus debilis]|uniref:DUF2487 domain-containing protein n=2 Tax=Caldibacillus debilis TaxID=301148 RepID=A0A420VF17_9BACI|nr:YpiF family protein [Caldibacillus debilis]MBO2480766.1 DUF2487 domain-containing protein [Bacillaceae bacterium]MBY6272735.1 DUF2487 domain-containing protein [Bacillaceae bacterium]OUM93017.1 MAG: hypothetical protein BAA03_06290 [Caldibacillus debilis]REJ16527.1 MAG: DUF2487 domain-containing protein [Caldibacillus debilis]REJ26901.1 MAG: DUF2487 domain-containing protein [Caldibacillus debilis]
MRWTAKDAALFAGERKYVDTLLIPFVPVTFGEGAKEAANSGEFVEILGHLLEKQFKGRVLLLPPYTYFAEFSGEKRRRLLDEWLHPVREADFRFVFFLSSDRSWKELLSDEDGEFLWVPSVPLEHLDEQNKRAIMENQAGQLLNIFVEKWQKAEISS